MGDMRMSSRGSSTSRRMARTRERGLQSVSKITRGAVAASLMLAAALSAVAAIGFAGHTSTTATGASSGTTSARGSSDGQRVALPPTGDGGALAPPVAPPISQPVQAPPPVTSGGS
jgi:hypothetical protein